MSALSDKYPSLVQAFTATYGRPPTDQELASETGNGQFAANDPRLAYSVANVVARGPNGANTSVALPSGIGNDQQVNQANQWLRAQPWYQAMLQAWGQDPNHVALSDQQRQLVLSAARARGVGISGDYEIDGSGNLTGVGHKLRNGLIIAGLAAGGALAAPAIAGALAGAGGAAGATGAAGAAGAAGATGAAGAAVGGTLASTAIGTGMIPAIAGGTGMAAAGTIAAGGTAALAPTLAGGTAAVAPAAGSSGGGASFAGIPAGTWLQVGSSLFGNLFGAAQQGSAADRAAAIQAAAAKYAADLQAQAQAQALAFQRGSAENAFQNNEVSRHGNYDVWAARERRLGPIGEEVGMGPREIPAYVPGVDPHFDPTTGATTTTTPTGTSGSPFPTTSTTGNPLDATAIQTALTGNYKALGVAPTGRGTGPTDLAYYADQIAKTGGLTAQNASYWFGPQGRIASDLSAARSGGGAAVPPPTGSSVSGGGMFAPYVAPTVSPFVFATPIAPIPGALGAY